jgi:sarcosine oxidase subunit alpha
MATEPADEAGVRRPTRLTPLHYRHLAHGARFADRDGWQVVAAYSGAEPEVAAARAGVGLADASAFAKLSLRGPAVRAAFPALAPGRVALPGESVLACRLTEDHLLLLAAAPTVPPAMQRLADLHDGTGVQTDVTSAYAGFEAIGPGLEGVLRRLTHLDVRATALPPDSCAETALTGVEALLVRHDRGPLPALRVYVAWDLGEYVWERIIEAGRDAPITPIGLDALALLS